MVLVRFDNGAMATAGDLRRTTMTYHGAEGVVADTWRRNIDRFHDADTAELAAIRSVDSGGPVRLGAVEHA